MNITDAAIRAYCDQYNATADLIDNDLPALTPADCTSMLHTIDDNAYRISILNADTPTTILALRITITDDRFATDDEGLRFFISTEGLPYIPLP